MMQASKLSILGTPIFRPLSLTIIATFFYVFMEWLFHITKPSVLSQLSVFELTRVLFSTTALYLCLVLPLGALSAIGGLLFARIRSGNAYHVKATAAIAASIPALLATFTVILLIDNFTYTLFRFNIGDALGPVRLLYLALYLYLYFRIWASLTRFLTSRIKPSTSTSAYVLSLSIAATSLLAFATATDKIDPISSDTPKRVDLTTIAENKVPELYNVLIMSSDGINARNLSVYGYERATTPFIQSIVNRGLLFENAFADSSSTTGSIASLLTGKSPLATKLIFRPDILRGNDQTEHFVGILKRLGYTTADIGVPWYADARSFGMKDAFSLTAENFYRTRQFQLEAALYEFGDRLPRSHGNEAEFFNQTASRIQGRLYHALGLRDLNNPITAVTMRSSGAISDRGRMNAVRSVITTSKRPWFVHVHLLDTHGPTFKVRSKHFSAGKLQTKDWMPDFYDDAIHDYDVRVREIFKLLEETAQVDRTVIVLTSDHGLQHQPIERVPLIFFFPETAHSGRRADNVSRLDIAPTLLDYLGISQPEWLDGVSLLDPSAKHSRTIVVVTPPANEKGTVQDYRAPYFGLGGVSVIECNHAYGLVLNRDPKLQTGLLLLAKVPEHTAPCQDIKKDTDVERFTFINQLLTRYGYPDIRATGPIHHFNLDTLRESLTTN